MGVGPRKLSPGGLRLCPTEEKDRAGKRAQWIKVLAARQENLNLISEIHMVEAEN